MKSRIYIIIVILIFWAGFVSSISFMEAWLKFRAEGVTLKVGLSIGKKVFTALNRSEWVFLFLYALLCLNLFKSMPASRFAGTLLIVLILTVQTFFILPPLNNRVEMILNGQFPGRSFHHLFFGLLEILKVGLLIRLSFQWYKAVLQVNPGPGIPNDKPWPDRAGYLNSTDKSGTKTKTS